MRAVKRWLRSTGVPTQEALDPTKEFLSAPNIASARGANAGTCGALAVNRVGSAAAIAADTTVGCWCVVFGGSEMGFMVALPSSSNGGIVDGRTGGFPVRGNVLAGVSGLEDDWFVTAPQFTPDELERRIDVGRRGTPEPFADCPL